MRLFIVLGLVYFTAVVTAQERFINESEFAWLVNEVHQLSDELYQLKADVWAPKRVAFKALLTSSLSPGPDELIVFDDVQFNIDNAYKNGIFVAPNRGYYLFSVTLCSYGSNHILADLLLNGDEKIGTILAGDDQYADCSSTTTVTRLGVGGTVEVKHHASNGKIIRADPEHQNSFTGVMLYIGRKNVE